MATINISDKSIVADSLIFKTKDGTAIEVADKRGNRWKLKVKGYQQDAIKQVLATIKQGEKYQVAGAFNLYHLSEKTVDVVLVNTNNANKKAIEQKLDEVYRQAVVRVNIVQEIRDFNLNAPGGTIESGQSGFAANYTRQQQAINRALRNRSDYKPSAYYLITTDLRPSSTGEKGLMPLGRQFGYIYGKDARTLAHELAHGAFKLKHPFSGKSYAFTPGSTDWLTDYSGGVRIPFVQWKEIHNPTLRIGLFDKDGEGEIVPLIIPFLLKAGASAAADALLQACMNYLFNEKVNTWSEAFVEINYWEATKTGLQSIIPWKIPGKKYTKKIIEASFQGATTVLYNYQNSTKENPYTQEQFLQDFLTGFISSVVGDLVSVYGVKGVKKAFKKIGFKYKGDLSTFVKGNKLASKGKVIVLTKLLKNSDYKKVYDDLLTGVTPRRFANELTLQEEAVFKFYTNESYFKFNDALIKGSSADDVLELEKLLNNTLDKVPSSPGTYFRGIGKAELDKIKRLRVGDDITYENFVSTTSEDFYAWRFLRSNKVKTGEGAFVEIVSKNGKSIDKFSDATEFEILHKSKSKFELKSIEHIKKEILNIDDVALSGATPDIVEDFYKIVLIEK